MINAELISYIKKQKELGVSEELYKKDLILQGWTDDDVKEAISSMQTQNIVANQIKKSNKLLLVSLVTILVLGSLVVFYLYNKNKVSKVEQNSQSNLDRGIANTSEQDSLNEETQSIIDENQNTASSVGDNEIKIISPANGIKVLAGSTVTFKVEAGKNITMFTFSANAPMVGDFGGLFADQKYDIHGGTFIFDYKIPNNAIGPIRAAVLGVRINNVLNNLNDKVELTAYSEASVTKLISYDENFLVPVRPNGSNPKVIYSKVFGIEAMFSDGIKRMIVPSDLEIKIEDPTIAKVELTPTLQVVGLKVGKTTMTVNYSGQSITIPIETYMGEIY